MFCSFECAQWWWERTWFFALGLWILRISIVMCTNLRHVLQLWLKDFVQLELFCTICSTNVRLDGAKVPSRNQAGIGTLTLLMDALRLVLKDTVWRWYRTIKLCIKKRVQAWIVQLKLWIKDFVQLDWLWADWGTQSSLDCVEGLNSQAGFKYNHTIATFDLR